MSYFQLVSQHRNHLGFGFLHYFFSLPGQSVLISLFMPDFNKNLGISNEQFGILYSIATLLSAFTLPFLGQYIDRYKIRYISVINGLILFLFILLLSASSHWIVLFIAVYGLRFSGQGMMALIASTGIARFFDHQRGKALSLSGLGLSSGEALLPVLVIWIIHQYDWVIALQSLGFSILVVFIPLTLLLVKSADTFQLPVAEMNHPEKIHAPISRRAVLSDRRFYVLLIPAVFPAFLLTGLFIHQNLLAANQGWSLEWLATCFTGFGLIKIITYFVAGPLVDRYTAKRIFPFFLLPLAFAMLILLFSTHPYAALFYLLLSGITTSFSAVLGAAVWAELYGVQNLGSIKSTISTFGIAATSLGSVLFGWLLSSTQTMMYTLGIVVALIFLISYWAGRVLKNM